MLTLYSIKSSETALSYYTEDGYYRQDQGETPHTLWWGKGAAQLNLSGAVDFDRFKALLDGHITDTITLGRKRHDGGVSHKPGYDLTFSAPKSVSMLAEIGHDYRLYAAHDRAVNQALTYLQTHAALTRVTKNHQMETHSTGHLLVAKIVHHTSRPTTDAQGGMLVDCNLHTHAIVMNAVFCADGHWRSLSEKHLYDLMKVGGMIYRSHLAIELQTLGYDIEKTSADGTLEVVGISRQHIERFSTRAKKIDAVKTELGITNYLSGKSVTTRTREGKSNMPRSVLRADWIARSDYDEIMTVLTAAQGRVCEIRQRKLDHSCALQVAVDFALQHLSENNAVFSRDKVIQYALAHQVGRVSLTGVERRVDTVVAEGGLISVGEGYYTTPVNLRKEQMILERISEGKGVMDAIASPTMVETYLASQQAQAREQGEVALNREQTKAVRAIVTQRDRFFALQGVAGSGKTTTLAHVVTVAQAAGYEVLGLATTASAARTLEQSIGIDCHTISHYVFHAPSPAADRPTLLIADEMSMASTDQIYRLCEITAKQAAKVLFVGDHLQLHSPNAGDPFGQMQVKGIGTVEMKKVMRQRTPSTKQAVQRTLAGEIARAFEPITDQLLVLSSKSARLRAIVEEYLGYDAARRQETLIIIPTHADRDWVNREIRERLLTDTADTECGVESLRKVPYSTAEKQDITTYQAGHVIRFNRRVKGINLRAGEYYTVREVRVDEHTVVLAHGKRSVVWSCPAPDKMPPLDIFDRREVAIRVGDQIRFTEHIKSQNLFNMDTAEVISLRQSVAIVRRGDGTTARLRLDYAAHQHWDYAWSSTVFAAQGKTTSHAIALLESTQHNLTHLRSFFVQLSRVRESIRLVIDDREALIATLEHCSGANENAIARLQVLQDAKAQVDKFATLYDKLSEQCYVIPSRATRLWVLAQHYVNLRPTQRRCTRVVTSRCRDSMTLTHLIRDGLESQGHLSGDAQNITVLTRRFMPDLTACKHYHVGDVIRFHHIQRRFGIRPGQYGNIIAIDAAGGVLTVKTVQGVRRLALTELFRSRKTDIEVFYPDRLRVAVGERIRWTLPDRSCTPIKHQVVTVEAITADTVVVRNDRRRTFTVPLGDYAQQHIEYGYVQTFTDAFPKRLDHVILQVDQSMTDTTIQQRGLALLASARGQAWVYTQDNDFFMHMLNKHTGDESRVIPLGQCTTSLPILGEQLDRYQQLRQCLGERWSTHRKQRKVDSGVSPFPSDLRALQDAYRELAYQLVSQGDLTTAVLKAFAVDPDKLFYQADKHRAKIAISRWQSEGTSLADIEAMIRQPDVHREYLHRAGLSVSALYQAYWQHIEREVLSDRLTAREHQLIISMRAYWQRAKQASQQWREIYAVSHDGDSLSRSQKQLGYQLSQQRNALAAAIMADPKRAWLVDRLPTVIQEQLAVQANQHGRRQQRHRCYRQAIASQYWPPVVAMEREARQGHVPPSPPQTHHCAVYVSHPVLLTQLAPHAISIVSSVVHEELNLALSKANNLLVWGQKGSVKLHLSGRRAGLVSDFERGIHGDLITFYAKQRDLPLKTARLELLRTFCLEKEHTALQRSSSSDKPLIDKKTTLQARCYERKQRHKAQSIWSESQPVKGTLAERYLRCRRITEPLSALECRYHPGIVDHIDNQREPNRTDPTWTKRPALVFSVKDVDENVLAVQVIFLHPETGEKDRRLKVAKRTIGSAKQHACAVYLGGGREVIVAEGPETAASLVGAKPNANIYASLGHPGAIRHYGYLAAHHRTETLLIAADRDGEGSVSWDQVKRAAHALSQGGLRVDVARPDYLPCVLEGSSREKFDFNDLLQHGGLPFVKYNMEPNFSTAVDESTYQRNSAELTSGDLRPRLRRLDPPREQIVNPTVDLADSGFQRELALDHRALPAPKKSDIQLGDMEL